MWGYSSQQLHFVDIEMQTFVRTKTAGIITDMKTWQRAAVLATREQRSIEQNE